MKKTEDGVYLNILYPELFDVCRNDSEKIQIAVMDPHGNRIDSSAYPPIIILVSYFLTSIIN